MVANLCSLLSSLSVRCRQFVFVVSFVFVRGCVSGRQSQSFALLSPLSGRLCFAWLENTTKKDTNVSSK